MQVLSLVKYPWTAAIIGLIWLVSACLLVSDSKLPVFEIVLINMVVSLIMAIIGFRVER